MMKEIRQYRKKPVVVEAVQLNTTNMSEVADWIGGDTAKIVVESEEAWKLGKGVPGFSMTIHTLEGDMTAKSGDYIIKGVNGEFYPCKPDIFVKTYEEADVEVQHGRWQLHEDGSGTCQVWGCRQKHVWDMDGWQNYCGHCGADMRNGGGRTILQSL